MIEWNDYIKQLLSSGTDIDDISISLSEGTVPSEIPPIIKASITILDKMIDYQGKRNILVFPEKMQSVFIFTLMKLLHNILSGKIKSSYNPTGFKVGEKLKVGNAVVEYLGTEYRNDTYCLMIKLADLNKLSAPMDILPIFQKVETKRRLSKYSQYSEAEELALAAMDAGSTRSKKIAYVSTMKTHMESSIFTMTSVNVFKEQLSKCVIDGKKVTDIFHIAQSDYEGNISNFSPGQMSGTPAIIFASDLYAISAAIGKGAPVQSIIIDGSNVNALLNQLDALDELLKLDIPIVLITDIANSFELEPYVARLFNIWRWDQETLTNELYDAATLSLDKKVKNCAKQTVLYLKSDGREISDTMKLLAVHRFETEEQSPQIMKLFENLNRLTFKALRNTIALSDMDREVANRTLSESIDLLSSEKHYLPNTIIDDYSKIISNLQIIYGESYSFTKYKVLQEFLRERHGSRIFLIVPEKSPKDQIQKFWDQWCLRSLTRTNIKVLLPSEYYSWPVDSTDITVICGWMKRAIMRKLIYSFTTSQYIVLLYDYENKWKNHDESRWNKALKISSNKSLIENAFSSNGIKVSTERFSPKSAKEEPEEKIDELGEIELILRENKFRQYINNGKYCGKDIVSAVPINFVGGYLSFSRVGHKLISATKIINSSADKIESKLPSELSVGDFIVVREADKDIIRELADIALENSGKGNLRELATKWREALKIELLFCNIESLHEKLVAEGCDKGFPTIKRWIEEDDVIAPRSKDDLKIIATVTGNEMLSELLDPVFDAAQEVRKAHTLAGRKLSEQLKLTLANELKKYEELDPFNFWEPIDLNIEGVGFVKVLKIIDIGSEVEVASTDTNRLIED